MSKFYSGERSIRGYLNEIEKYYELMKKYLVHSKNISPHFRPEYYHSVDIIKLKEKQNDN